MPLLPFTPPAHQHFDFLSAKLAKRPLLTATRLLIHIASRRAVGQFACLLFHAARRGYTSFALLFAFDISYD